MARVFIGLGSNLGDRAASLAGALAMMNERGIAVTAASVVEETDPVDLTDQPRFLNQVAMAETLLTPESLLRELKEIERALGRKPGIPKGPRSIDLDILLYGNEVVRKDGLVIPHGAIEEREFVLSHLVALAPDLASPVTGAPYRDVLAALRERRGKSLTG